MAKQEQSRRDDQSIPDPATVYERAKPAQQSPAGRLDQPAIPPATSPEDKSESNNRSPNSPDASKRPPRDGDGPE